MDNNNLERKIVAALRPVLRVNERDDRLITLNRLSNHSVAGRVVSGSFDGETPYQRQERIWQHLEKALEPAERAKITFIAAETPQEHEELMAPPVPANKGRGRPSSTTSSRGPRRAGTLSHSHKSR